jgi:apolipoprotein N-acyltransferase
MRIDWGTAIGPPIRTAIVQASMPREPDPQRALERSLEVYGELSKAAVDREQATLVVWGESAVTRPLSTLQRYADGMRRAARTAGVDYVFGAPQADPASGRIKVAAHVIGAEEGAYAKRHLIPFVEYLPPWWRSLAPATLVPPTFDAVHGPAEAGTLRVVGQPAAVSICIESIYGFSLQPVARDATLLLSLSNDSAMAGTTEPAQHLDVARARAIELGLPLVRAADSGISAITDHRGALLAQAAQGERTLVVASVQPRTAATPWARWGWFALLLSVSGAGLVAWAATRTSLRPATRRPRDRKP